MWVAIMNNIQRIKKEYLRTWRITLEKFSELSDRQISELLQRMAKEFSGRISAGIILHELPIHWVAGRLIPKALAKKLTDEEINQVRTRIELKIYGRVAYPDLVKDYDWNAAKQRLARILGRFQNRL
jgi:hypothetical protein